MKLRISARVWNHLEGSQAAYTQEADVDMAAIIAKIRAANRRKDGSHHIEVTDPEQLDTLRIYMEAMETGAADNLGYADEDRDALADLNAARAVLRALANR